MNIGRIKRILIGPSTILFVAFVCISYSRPDGQGNPPLERQLLTGTSSEIELSAPETYQVYYEIPLLYGYDSDLADVRQATTHSNEYQNVFEALSATKVSMANADGRSITPKPAAGTFIFKDQSAHGWRCGRQLALYDISTNGKYKVQIADSSRLTQLGGKLAIALIPPETPKRSRTEVVLSLLALPIGILAFLWGLLFASPWRALADRYQSKCDISTLRTAGDDALIGYFPASFLPMQKLLFRETTDGLELALTGVARHLGFGPIRIPWESFTGAVLKGKRLQLKVSDPNVAISIRAQRLTDVLRYVQTEQPLSAQVDPTPSIESKTDEPEPTLSRGSRFILGFLTVGLGSILTKLYVFDVLQQARQHMASVTVSDELVILSPIVIVLGILVIVYNATHEEVMQDNPLERKGLSGLLWKGFLFLLGVALLSFWVWFRVELNSLGYSFF